MKFKNSKIEKLYKYLSRMSREAYKDQFLISNVIFSKQESRGLILETYLTKEVPPEVTFLFAAKKICLYLAKNIFSLMSCVFNTLLHYLSQQNFQYKDNRELIFLDIYFSVDQILSEGKLEDSYFPGLSEYLTKKKIEYVYTPRWFGSNRPLDLFRVFRILKKSRVPVLTHFQVLHLVDYIKTLKFWVLYPFSVFRFIKSLGSSYEDKLIGYALWSVLDGRVIEHYMRFLMGKRLSSITSGRIKCFSWYENLATEKNFYLGLRALSKKIEIVGVQLFVRPNTLMNIVPDRKEIPFKVVPDKILVNGSGYCFDLDSVCVNVGPSLRYKYLFDSDLRKSSEKIILVLLPYWGHVVNYILKIIQEINWPAPIVLKFHPTMDSKKYESKFPRNFSVTNEALSLSFQKTLIAVGHGTGALIEAAAFGIPAIDIQYPEKFSHDYTPEIGKGIIWDKAEEVEAIKSLISEFQKNIVQNPDRLKEEADRLKSLYFTEPTDELIGKAFGLD